MSQILNFLGQQITDSGVLYWLKHGVKENYTCKSRGHKVDGSKMFKLEVTGLSSFQTWIHIRKYVQMPRSIRNSKMF